MIEVTINIRTVLSQRLTVKHAINHLVLQSHTRNIVGFTLEKNIYVLFSHEL